MSAYEKIWGQELIQKSQEIDDMFQKTLNDMMNACDDDSDSSDDHSHSSANEQNGDHSESGVPINSDMVRVSPHPTIFTITPPPVDKYSSKDDHRKKSEWPFQKGAVDYTRGTITILDSDVISELKHLQEFRNDAAIFNSTPTYNIKKLFSLLINMINQNVSPTYLGDCGDGNEDDDDDYYDNDRKQHTPSQNLSHIIEFLKMANAITDDVLANMKEKGVISYEHLWYLFRNESMITIFDEDSQSFIGGKITTTSYVEGMIPKFSIGYNIIKTDGQKFLLVTSEVKIYAFDGVRNLEDLSVKVMTKTMHETLTNRGKIFQSVAIGHHYHEYSGPVFTRMWWGTEFFKSDGRVMIDATSHRRFNPGENESSSTVKMIQIPDNLLYMTFPTIKGFSFSSKKWGEIVIDNIRPVVFRDSAFDRLVLDPSKKKLIKALVMNKDKGIKDIVGDGKGSGVILLLHGVPGVGKTLTAESISELLHKPLYSISIGQLGTDVKNLEMNLRNVLEIGEIWDAVVLLDEADVFLEARQDHDLNRNAMISIFLRTLEYQTSVLFLTTNRVKQFDAAFRSRISLALKYEALDVSVRLPIWEGILKDANITLDQNDLNRIAWVDINGRQIRTTIRLACCLAYSESIPPNITHIDKVLDTIVQFDKDLQDEK